MPTGIIINTIAIFLGGIAGALLGDKLPEKYKEQLNMIFGLCSMGMGIAVGWTYEIYASGNIRDYYRDISRIVF